MKIVKVSIPGFGYKLDISQYVGDNGGIWGGCKYYVNDPDVKEADYWFVVDDLCDSVEAVRVSPKCVCYLTGEVMYEDGYFDVGYRRKFLSQFSKVISCHDIYGKNVSGWFPFLPWMINANHGSKLFSKSVRDVAWLSALQRVDKVKDLSVFCSDKVYTSGHRLRFKFVHALKEHFGDRVDWFGNGINSVDEKWDGIAPYKYHIVLENKIAHDVITEKIFDSFLGLAYPIYWGAPNIGEYFPEESFGLINIRDVNGAIDQIHRIIDEDCWGRNYDLLLESKSLVLGRYNSYSRMSDIVDQEMACQSDVQYKCDVVLRSQDRVGSSVFEVIPSYLFEKLIKKLVAFTNNISAWKA